LWDRTLKEKKDNKKKECDSKEKGKKMKKIGQEDEGI
jgi:hypothetical protein